MRVVRNKTKISLMELPIRDWDQIPAKVKNKDLKNTLHVFYYEDEVDEGLRLYIKNTETAIPMKILNKIFKCKHESITVDKKDIIGDLKIDELELEGHITKILNKWGV